jgi:hypothetical protein
MAQPALGELARFKTPEERVAAWRKVIDVAGEKCGTFKLTKRMLTNMDQWIEIPGGAGRSKERQSLSSVES